MDLEWKELLFAGEIPVVLMSFTLDARQDPCKRLAPPLPSGTSGSDSPGQAVEAEEIVKQLDMEQGEETPTSTATSREVSGISLYPASQPLPLALRPPPDGAVEEGEIVTGSDLPPLTGMS